MATFFRLYQKSFDNRPYSTLICANATLNALGDVAAQSAQRTLAKYDLDSSQKPPPSYDYIRTLRFAVFGATMGPVIGRWVKFLEHKFPLRSVGGKASFTALAKRVASDQIIMAPFGLVVFLGSMGIMEGHSSSQIKRKYKDLYMPALLANWTIWPFAQMVNFRFMPLAYRVPFQSTCGIFWTLYLSLLNSSENKNIDRGAAINISTMGDIGYIKRHPRAQDAVGQA